MHFPVKNVVCSTWVPLLINLECGIITRKIVGKQKEKRNICSHLFLSIFSKWSSKFHRRFQYYFYWQNRWVWSQQKRGILEKSIENGYSIWVEQDRLIVLFVQITLLNTYFWHVVSLGFVFRSFVFIIIYD